VEFAAPNYGAECPWLKAMVSQESESVNGKWYAFSAKSMHFLLFCKN